MFIPSGLVRQPFTNTAFGMSVSFGFASATGDRLDASGNPVGKEDFTYSAIALGFDLEVAVLPWLSVRGDVAGGVFTGIDGESVLVVGASGFGGGTVGLVAGRPFGERLRAALTFDVSYVPQLEITIADGLVRAIETGTIDTGEIFAQTNQLVFSGGVTAAYAVNRAFGLSGAAAFVRPRLERNSITTHQDGVSLAALADVDFRRLRGSIPLGVTAGWRGDLPIGGSGLSRVHHFIAGLSYTGRDALALGVELEWREFTLRSTLDSSAAIATVAMRYYW